MIKNIDCLEYMKTLPDNYFDLVITDPPYGIGEKNIQNNKSRTVLAKATDWEDKGEWDNNIPNSEVFKEILRVSKNQIIFGGNYMTSNLPPSSCWIVWDKDNGSNDFADCELAWTSFKTSVRKFKWRWNGMLQDEMGLHKEKRLHPTQKPVPLGRWILDKYANKGDKIFDPFAGSGSFLVACHEKGFEFVGCEINEKYCDVINERLKQKPLFALVEKGEVCKSCGALKEFHRPYYKGNIPATCEKFQLLEQDEPNVTTIKIVGGKDKPFDVGHPTDEEQIGKEINKDYDVNEQLSEGEKQ